MIKLLNLVSPQVLCEEVEEKELPDEFKVFERGLEFLKQRIAALNKKAVKYKVPTLDIDIISTEMVKVINPELKKMQMSQPIIMPLDKGLLADPNSWVYVKQYTVRIDGEPPHIEGYEFIARLEHTPEGNFIYTNPKVKVNLPAEFKTMNQRCDVCNTYRDRHDTFVLRMTQDDPVRFPNKKAGDFLIVGRNCLARFLPGGSVAGLIAYTKMIDNLENDIKAAMEMKDDEPGEGWGGGGGKYYEDSNTLLAWLIATYLHTGKYVSKKQANAYAEAGGHGPDSISTLMRARNEMHPNFFGLKTQYDKEKAYPIYFRMTTDEAFRQKVEQMAKEFEEWLPKQDWDAKAAAKPDFADFFHNLKLVAGQEYLKGNHFGFFSALFQLFLRDKQYAEKKAEAEKQAAAAGPAVASPIQFGPELIGKRLRDIAKEVEIRRLQAAGMDEKAIKKAIRGKVWGWEVECKKITEYEKTQTFGYGDAGIGYRIFFRDGYGNDFLWFASNNPGFDENGKYIIDGTVTKYDPQNKYSGRPQTNINRVKIVKDFQNPEKPPQPDTPLTPGA